MAWAAWVVIEGLFEFPYTTPALEWSLAYIYFIFPIAFVLMSIRILQVQFNRLVRGIEPVDSEAEKIAITVGAASQDEKEQR